MGSLDNMNDLGIFDMHGNVSEWVQDWYGEYPDFDFSSSSSVEDPKGPLNGWARVARGGSWNKETRYARSAYRDSLPSIPAMSKDSTDLGFRLVRTLKE